MIQAMVLAAILIVMMYIWVPVMNRLLTGNWQGDGSPAGAVPIVIACILLALLEWCM